MPYKVTDQERLVLIGQILSGLIVRPQSDPNTQEEALVNRAARLATIVIDKEEQRVAKMQC